MGVWDHATLKRSPEDAVHTMKMYNIICFKCSYVLAYRHGKEWMTPFPFEEADDA